VEELEIKVFPKSGVQLNSHVHVVQNRPYHLVSVAFSVGNNRLTTEFSISLVRWTDMSLQVCKPGQNKPVNIGSDEKRFPMPGNDRRIDTSMKHPGTNIALLDTAANRCNKGALCSLPLEPDSKRS
jgi:hypothetical protein